MSESSASASSPQSRSKSPPETPTTIIMHAKLTKSSPLRSADLPIPGLLQMIYKGNIAFCLHFSSHENLLILFSIAGISMPSFTWSICSIFSRALSASFESLPSQPLVDGILGIAIPGLGTVGVISLARFQKSNFMTSFSVFIASFHVVT